MPILLFLYFFLNKIISVYLKFKITIKLSLILHISKRNFKEEADKHLFNDDKFLHEKDLV